MYGKKVNCQENVISLYISVKTLKGKRNEIKTEDGYIKNGSRIDQLDFHGEPIIVFDKIVILSLFDFDKYKYIFE